jgi:4-hydroxythreonine-4-phosphate dehydrogenase
LRPRLAIPLGTLEGVGPEVVSRALARLAADGDDLADVVVLGPRGALEAVHERLGPDTLDPGALRDGDIALLQRPHPGPLLLDPAPHLRPWVPPAAPGFEPRTARLTLRVLEMAVRLALRRDVGAIVTAPLDKRAFAAAGLAFPGQTELLAARAGVTDELMVLSGPRLTVGVLTTHIALADVPRAVTAARIGQGLRRLARFASVNTGNPRPRLAVAGLNPHLGDDGVAGDDDARVVRPAVEALSAEGLDVTGPISGDAVFALAAGGRFDAVLGLYHDQALIPVKLLDPDHTVNVTVGLPFVRTSPDHGTAYDKAWGREPPGAVRPDSTLAAIAMARRLASSSPT